MKYLIVLTICLFVAIPAIAAAQRTGFEGSPEIGAGTFQSDGFARTQTYDGSGLVTCEGPNCNWCSFVSMINRIVTWLIAFLSVLAVLAFVFTGFKLVTSMGNPAEWGSAKRMFTNVVVGIIIVLAAWLIVDTTMRILTGQGINSWLPSDCGGALAPIEGNSSTNNGGVTGTTGGTCTNCKNIQGIPCKNSNSCTVADEYAARLSGLSGAGIEITEAYPPTRTHQAACHSNGTCTDVVFADRNFTPERVRQFQALASQSGFRAVYEPPAGVSCSGYSNCLPYSTTRSTGHHFSLYMQ